MESNSVPHYDSAKKWFASQKPLKGEDIRKISNADERIAQTMIAQFHRSSGRSDKQTYTQDS
jgi:hypothetical protein